MRFVLLIGVLWFNSTGCTKRPEKVQDLASDGRAVYQRHCTACHSINPKIDGALGPAIAGASLELLEARVLNGNYPDGYEAKRKTAVMPKLPFLKDQIPALHAYLQSVP